MKTVIYDYSKLRGKIKEVVGTEGKFADMIGRTQNFLTSVFQSKSYFTQRDIANASEVLGIDNSEIGLYFFAKEVHEVRTFDE